MGEVDVLVEGRSPVQGGARGGARYPQRRLRVRLTPSALFFAPASEVRAQVNTTFQVHLFHAPLLANGSPGRRQFLRPGINAAVSVVSSHPNGLSPTAEGVSLEDVGAYRAPIFALREGVYTLSLTSPLIPPAPDHVLTVRAVRTLARLVFQEQTLQLAKDHVASVSFSANVTDTLVFTSEDPGRLLVGTDNSANSASFSVRGSGSSQLFLAALSAEGTASVRVVGTVRGEPVDEHLNIRLAPYTAVISSGPATLGVDSVSFSSSS